MAVALKKLNKLLLKEVVIVQLDGKAFKGKIIEIEDLWIVLSNVLEFSAQDKKWKVPNVAIPPESAVEDDIIKHDKLEVVKLREVIFGFNGIMRIYPVSFKSTAVEKTQPVPTPFSRPVMAPQPKPSEGDYVIRSVTGEDKTKKKW